MPKNQAPTYHIRLELTEAEAELLMDAVQHYAETTTVPGVRNEVGKLSAHLRNSFREFGPDTAEVLRDELAVLEHRVTELADREPGLQDWDGQITQYLIRARKVIEGFLQEGKRETKNQRT